jgi:hypothetical protein
LTTTTQLEDEAATGLEHRSGRGAPDRPVLSIRGRVPRAEVEGFIAEALHDIRVFMQEHDVTPSGPPFSICRPRGGSIDVEAGWPAVVKPLAGTSRIHVGSLPSSFTGPHAAVNPVESRR